MRAQLLFGRFLNHVPLVRASRSLGASPMLRSVFATILFVAILLLASLPGAHAAGRIALVVGVSNYEHAGRLPNTLNDAKDMGAALKRLGFDVDTVLDPGRSALEAEIGRASCRKECRSRWSPYH